MLDPGKFREIVSGRRRGPAASLTRCLLRAAEVPYTLAVNRRNRQYDLGRRDVRRVGVPVVSIGNLTLGGTGKTPMVKWLARWFQKRGQRVAIVSRGYGAAAGQENDEALELHQSLPGVPHVQNPNRVVAATRAIEEFNCTVIVLDDGFQHRRLGRNLDIVLLDALEPFGYDHVFPRGTLREPVAGLSRAHVICLSRADSISADEREAIRRRAARMSPNAEWCELIHAPDALINSAGATAPLQTLRGQRVAAFCGIGNPTGFRHTLDATGCEVTAWHVFPDHHAYSEADVQLLGQAMNRSTADLIVCTHKDLVKIPRGEINGVPLWAITVEMQFSLGQEMFERALSQFSCAAATVRS
jgi:tetraacyldisaccharide 4'-kinase